MYAGAYLLKLQIDDVVLGGRGQSCPGMPKKAIKTIIGGPFSCDLLFIGVLFYHFVQEVASYFYQKYLL